MRSYCPRPSKTSRVERRNSWWNFTGIQGRWLDRSGGLGFYRENNQVRVINFLPVLSDLGGTGVDRYAPVQPGSRHLNRNSKNNHFLSAWLVQCSQIYPSTKRILLNSIFYQRTFRKCTVHSHTYMYGKCNCSITGTLKQFIATWKMT